jgi:mono/diheme cytochrome c family protein
LRHDARYTAGGVRALLLMGLAGLLFVSCKTKSFPQMEYMPDMYRQWSLRPQEPDPTAPAGVGMRQPPPGTVPRNYEPYRLALTDTAEANKISNPLAATPDVLEAGRKYFNNYCIVCHGARGDGHGFIVPKFTMPPVLYSDKVTNWSDGRIFHVITYGQGLMMSYATQLLPEQRWAIIHYVRALQRAARPTEEDLKLAKSSPFTLQDDLPDTAKPVMWPKK